jgi:hypothetical protein
MELRTTGMLFLEHRTLSGPDRRHNPTLDDQQASDDLDRIARVSIEIAIVIWFSLLIFIVLLVLLSLAFRELMVEGLAKLRLPPPPRWSSSLRFSSADSSTSRSSVSSVASRYPSIRSPSLHFAWGTQTLIALAIACTINCVAGYLMGRPVAGVGIVMPDLHVAEVQRTNPLIWRPRFNETAPHSRQLLVRVGTIRAVVPMP